MVTLQDVAERAGVSVRTVSYAVNTPERVGADTLERVRTLLAEMKYEPNRVARGLRSGRSNLIGLIVPSLQTPYFAEVTRELMSELSKHDLTLVIDQTDGDSERERKFLMESSMVTSFDALIVSPLGLTAHDVDSRARQKPIVLLGERVLHGQCDHVVMDNVAAARAATEYLISRGYERIAAIGPLHYDSASTTALRFDGFTRAMTGAGLDPYRYEVKVSDFTRAEGVTAMTTLLDGSIPPDAVFCFSDLLALGAMRAAHRRHIELPHELGIVGVDDVEDGRYSTPTLSTVSPDKHELARQTVELLLRRLAGEVGPWESKTVPFTVIPRESTR